MCLAVGALWGTWGSPFTRNFKRWLEGPGGEASLSVGVLLGGPRWELLFWGSGRIWGGGLRGGTSLSVGPRWGICRELICWGLEKTLEMGTFPHRGSVKNREGSVQREV